MSSSEILRRAIDAARAGRKVEAREMLLRVVEEDPGNESAWIWLSGLVDTFEDKIIACENALTLNPQNEKVRAYLLQVQQQQQEHLAALRQRDMQEARELLAMARDHARSGDRLRAVQLVQRAAEKQRDLIDAWLLLAQLSSSAAEKVNALEQAYSIEPTNQKTIRLLEQARELRDDPLRAAAHHEQVGNFDRALVIYKEQAGITHDPREFDRIYKEINRIERLQQEKISYVSPRISIIRLTFGWPLLYCLLVLIQVGLNPFSHSALHLWLAFPLVVLGSFLLSFSEIRSRHSLWKKILLEDGDGSRFARLVTAVAGWMLIIFPHLLLLIDSLNRLRTFQIPAEPF